MIEIFNSVTDKTNFMKTGKGKIILSVWFFINILPAIGSLLFISFGKHAPALQTLFTQEEIQTLDLRLLATIDGLAILLNTLIVLYCSLALFVLIKHSLKAPKWTFVFLATGSLLLQTAGYTFDHFLEGKNFLILNISTFILLIGFSFWSHDLFIQSRKQANNFHDSQC